MLVISIYDILAVRFGYMMWLVKKLAQSEVLPAFIIPRQISKWNVDLRRAKVIEGKPAQREFSILGGGDIAFPLLLIASIFSVYGFYNSGFVFVIRSNQRLPDSAIYPQRTAYVCFATNHLSVSRRTFGYIFRLKLIHPTVSQNVTCH